MTHVLHPATDHASVIDATTQLVDVRRSDEFATGTITGAVNIPLDELPDRLDELTPSRRVVLLCRSGNRSGRAAELLIREGFTDVVDLDGGMLALEATR